MQRYFAKERLDNSFILSDDDYYHILKVMRMKEKDKIQVVYQKDVYLCDISFHNNLAINIIEKLNQPMERTLDITLVIPLLKEQKMDLIFQKATELGVSTIIPVNMERSIIKINDEKESRKINRWLKICKEASEQSMRNTIPTITKISDLEDLKELDGVKFICSTTEKELNIKTFLKNSRNYDKIITVIGPEGGLSPKEEMLLEAIGFTKVSLGNRIMRVETVPLFLLSIINYEFME